MEVLIAQLYLLFVTPWTVVHLAPLSMNPPGKNIAVGSHSLIQESSRLRDQTQVSCVAGRLFTVGELC